MKIDDLKKDLPERTIDILNRYFSREKYDVTLLINCLTALLILPREKFFKNEKYLNTIPEEIPPDWGLTKEHIKRVSCPTCGYKLREVVRHMRNAIAHMRIKALPDSSNKIEKIQFKDIGFEVEIPVEDLRKFVIKLAQHVIEYVKSSKQTPLHISTAK